MEPTLLEYRSNNYSQNGEDGIILEILNRLNISSGWFCEFGAWDGKHLSNTYNLVKNGDDWKGILIEGDDNKYTDLEETISEHPNQLHGINSYVTSSGHTALDRILDDTDIPTNFEILSIDIDGPDYFVWKNTTKYKPKIVVIEINRELGSDLRFISDMAPNNRYKINPEVSDYPSNFPQERKGEQIRLFGTSFKSMVELGKSKGYVAVSCTQHNIIFVKEDTADKLDLDSKEYEEPSILFLDKWAKGNKPIFNKSLNENIVDIKNSINKNGIAKTIYLGLLKMKSDIF